MQGPQAIPISALVNIVRDVLESSELFSDLWVVGEVSNFSRPSSGHRYFSLKDPQGALRTVMFRDSMPGLALKDGDRVLAHGRVTVYPQRGELQFVADFVRPEGVGIVSARFEQLRAKLEAEGLFEPGRKRPLPAFPLRIGLVTSPTGAAIQDIKQVLGRRWPLATLILAPAVVQGETAAAQVAGALMRLANEEIDLAIIARGGGASEDLWAFNDERVARLIFGFPVPTITGIGHETDETIADYVADLRAATPTAAAERATPNIAEVVRAITSTSRGMANECMRLIAAQAGTVDSAALRIERCAPNIGDLARGVDRLAGICETGAGRNLQLATTRLAGADARLTALNPHATLARGFAIVQQAESRKVVSSTRRVKPGDRLQVSVSDGAFWAEVS